MIAVDWWKARQLICCAGYTGKREAVENCANRGKTGATTAYRALCSIFIQWRQQKIQMIHRGSSQVSRWGPEPRNQAFTVTRFLRDYWREVSKIVNRNVYCKASMRRVITRLRSLSERRNSSILLME